MRHPFLVSLDRYDFIDGRLVIVMELADGNLWQHFQECCGQSLPGIPRDELLGYLADAAEVLDLLSEEYQLQHLDIKPRNLLLQHRRVKVADFGMVKDLDGMRTTRTGGMTMEYAAPEMFEEVVSRFCDQYSLAVVYQQMLTGKLPFSGTSLGQLAAAAHQSAAGSDGASRPATERSSDERWRSCRKNATAAVPSSCRPSSRRAAPDRLVPAAVRSLAQSAPAEVPAEEPTVPARSRTHGSGLLFPALVIGAGGLGLEVLRRVHTALRYRFGSLQAVPNIRLLGLDTDPEAVAAATGGDGLPPELVIQAFLRRAAQYQQKREGRPSLDSWLDERWFHRLTRHPAVSGVRALGRLAFVDHYRTIVGRVKELEQCADPAVLAEADRRTGLGISTNFPRVYVVAGLGGGTGGGMFLDLAYLVRRRLREAGYLPPDVVGVFLLPPVRPFGDGARATGNAFAALAELQHYSSGVAPFTGRYLSFTAPTTDPQPPFRRCLVLPAATDPLKSSSSVETAAALLVHELTTVLGREAADEPAVSARTTCRVPSLDWLRWPRSLFLRWTARHLCRNLMHSWTTCELLHGRRQEAPASWISGAARN